jgi:hypothetical protein
VPPRDWLEIKIQRVGADLQALVEGSRGEEPLPMFLGPDFAVERLERFAGCVRQAAVQGEPLGGCLARAQELYRALFREKVQEVLLPLRERAGGGQVLLRLMLHGGALQEFPWEALCEPDTSRGFLGNSTQVLAVRGVRSAERWQPREEHGAVRVLPIAPTDGAGLAVLRGALGEQIAAGEVDWLEPLTGGRTRLPFLFSRLEQEPAPHIIHFIGHGAVNEHGAPVLRLGDVDGEESWVEVELLAQHLTVGFRRSLRLIILDACEGARPGSLACAAELLARVGADAVVAHLWPVRADVTRRASATFYRTLTGAAARQGDVALSLNHARRLVLAEFGGSAEAFSPVLYLRGRDSVLFEFRGRRVAPPRPVPPSGEGLEPSPALARLLERPFTLLLGDRWRDEHPVLEGFRERLRRALSKEEGAALAGMSMSALTQRYELRFGAHRLNSEFQQVFGAGGASSPLIKALAQRLRPGVHVTLLRLPVLELAMAERWPDVTLYVIEPPDPRLAPATRRMEQVTIMRRDPSRGGWEQIYGLPASLDLERDFVVLRLYCGYLPPSIFMRPLITEDDYLLGIQELKDTLPPDLTAAFLKGLNMRPVLLLGMSLLTWHHRMLLYRLFGERPLDPGSVVILEPGEAERELWERGTCLPAHQGVQVIEASPSRLVQPLDTLAQEAAP